MADQPRGRHPLEVLLNAPAEDILDAIQGGFRAIIDVKGKLAELFLKRQLEGLKAGGQIQGFEWLDKDGEPDFRVQIDNVTLRLEAKNVRSSRRARGEAVGGDQGLRVVVELQKTRNSKDGTPTRGYRADEFDCLAACLFNRTGKWEYVYASTLDLERRPTDPDRLRIMQRVPLQPSGIWKGSLLDVLKAAAEAKRRGG